MKFKKLICGIISACIAFSGISVFAAAENIIINGKEAEIPAEMGSIMEKDDRTFVPIRFIMENLGCEVNFIDSTKLAVIESISCTYLIQDGNPKPKTFKWILLHLLTKLRLTVNYLEECMFQFVSLPRQSATMLVGMKQHKQLH